MPISLPSSGQTNWGPTLDAALTALDNIGPSNGLETQTLSVSGAVVVNAASGWFHVITLAANATASSITNASAGQRLTIAWKQDATGSRTYVWPTNCKFAGGAAPAASTTANYVDTVTFVYDGTNWIETSRAVAVR